MNCRLGGTNGFERITMRFEGFSERYGYIKVDNALQIEGISYALKNVLGSYLYKQYQLLDRIDRPSMAFMECLFMYYLKMHITQIEYSVIKRQSQFQNIYNKLDWHQIYTFVEFFYFYYQKNNLTEKCESYTDSINDILERERSGYRLIDGKIVPITDENEISSIKEAIEENLLDTARTHIQEALQKLSDREHPDYRNSIKESISAVEAVCRNIAKEKTLDDALPKLKNKGIIIPKMLEEGMKKMYCFTNGRDGIRHALMKEDIVVDFEEAKYMLVVCSAFVNYLKAKVGKINAK